MPTGSNCKLALLGRFPIKLNPRGKAKKSRRSCQWERMDAAAVPQGTPAAAAEPDPDAENDDDDDDKLAPARSSNASSSSSGSGSRCGRAGRAFIFRIIRAGGLARTAVRRHQQQRRMKTLRLGGSRRVRLHRSMASLRRWVVSVAGWAGVAVQRKAKLGLAFLREALKLLITGLHAPSTELGMSRSGYHGGPYLDEVLLHRRLEMHKLRRSKSMSDRVSASAWASVPAAPGQHQPQFHRRHSLRCSTSSKGTAAGNGNGNGAALGRGWSHLSSERIITFPGSSLARRHAPHKGLATIAESASETEIGRV